MSLCARKEVSQLSSDHEWSREVLEAIDSMPLAHKETLAYLMRFLREVGQHNHIHHQLLSTRSINAQHTINTRKRNPTNVPYQQHTPVVTSYQSLTYPIKSSFTTPPLNPSIPLPLGGCPIIVQQHGYYQFVLHFRSFPHASPHGESRYCFTRHSTMSNCHTIFDLSLWTSCTSSTASTTTTPTSSSIQFTYWRC